MIPNAIVILDGNQRSALASVRSLGRAGYQVAVAETAHPCLGSSSRFCAERLVCPDPVLDADGFSLWLSDLATHRRGDVLMPMSDVTVPMALANESVQSFMRLALPSRRAYADASDKYSLFEIAERIGAPVPHTMLVSRSTLCDPTLAAFPLPAVVKARQSVRRSGGISLKRTTRYAFTQSELIDTLRDMLSDDDDSCLVQEFITGAGAGVFALYNQGVPVFFFAHRRIREKPPSGGVSVLCESVPLEPRSMQIAQQILGELNWHGVAMVEFKIDEMGTPWLIEINARFWGSLQLAVDSGADFPAMLCRIACGDHVSAPLTYRSGNQLRWLLGDLDNLYATLRHRRYAPRILDKVAAIARFLLPWKPGLRYELLRATDPNPALFAMRTYVSSAFKGWRQRLHSHARD